MSDQGTPLDIPFLQSLLQVIVGEPLTAMWRAWGQAFEFGERRPATDRKGRPITRGDLCLKFISADWRVVQQDRIVLGSTDLTDAARFYGSEKPPTPPYDEEALRSAQPFLDEVEKGQFVVQSIEVGKFADVTILLTHKVVVQSFGSSGVDHDLWHFSNRRAEVSCLVGPSGYYAGKIGERPSNS